MFIKLRRYDGISVVLNSNHIISLSPIDAYGKNNNIEEEAYTEIRVSGPSTLIYE